MTPHGNGNGELSIGAGPFKVLAKGRYVILVTAVLCASALPAYLFYQHDDKTIKALLELRDGQQEVIYMMSLTEREREALRLRMPDSLRFKLVIPDEDHRRPHP